MTAPTPPRALPTLEDVARVAGVSRATVSRVIRAERRVAPELQETVERAIEATGYVPNRAARTLVTGRTGAVVVAVTGAGPPADGVGPSSAALGLDVYADPFFGRVIWGLIRALRDSDVHAILTLVESDADRRRVLGHLRQGAADGALLVSTLARDPLPGLLAEAGLAAVTFARPDPAVPVSFVDTDHHAGGRLAAERLLTTGRRRFGVVGGPPDVPAAVERLAGFRDELARRGVPYVPSVDGDFTVESGEAATARLLDTDPTLDAIFAANDLMAVGALHEFRRRDRRAGEDVGLIGFDDSWPAAQARPTLTTVRQPIEEMTARMATILLERVAQPGLDPIAVVLDPDLVVRDSG